MSLPNPPVLTITTQEDAVELVLTQSAVVMRLSDQLVNQVHEEIHSDPDVQRLGGLMGRFVRFVTSSAEKMISGSIEYDIDDIKSVAYTDGALVFTYVKKHGLSFEDLTVGDQDHDIIVGKREGKHDKNASVLSLFAPEDAQAFVARFAQVKARSRE
ncbi:MAG TPA: hypothetical protein VMV29_05495 [Ktedonobacterales bacterium]|nr:hypothetical protein [Ktedonobacterales bacterium]